MPELPEVETTILGLKPLINCTVNNIKIYNHKLRYYIPKKIIKKHKDSKIINIVRLGKYILIYLSNTFIIVFHLGMSGRLRLLKNKKIDNDKHDHFKLFTDNNYSLVFNDPRKFGFIDFDKVHLIMNRNYILKLGKDALSNNLSSKYLRNKIFKSIVPIKQILLDQTIISGIGNIYASEILFDAKISPFCKGKDLSINNCDKVIKSTKKILNKAIKARGSTLRNYVAADGTAGNFQKNFKVYNRSGEKILGKKIFRIVQYGRSTFYCPDIQILG